MFALILYNGQRLNIMQYLTIIKRNYYRNIYKASKLIRYRIVNDSVRELKNVIICKVMTETKHSGWTFLGIPTK